MFDIAATRKRFPALKGEQVFFDNAGGSQVLDDVIESISEYLAQTNVQLGASYGISQQSTARYEDGYKAAARFVNANPDEIVIGPSTTQLLRNLSFAMDFQPGDEIILSLVDHESNIDPWLDMAKRQKLTVKWWAPADKKNPKLEAHVLKELLSERTRFVACTCASNLLGTIHDIKAITTTVHTIPGAVFCADAVAYAPHRQIDVQALGVDYLAFSWYKVFGPHIALLFGSREAQKSLQNLGHYFNPSDSLAAKIGLAGSTYEHTACIPSLVAYFGSDLAESWREKAAHEEKVVSILLSYLSSREGITIYGEVSPDANLRVATVSFTVQGRSSTSIVKGVERGSQFGFRNGHMYSKRLAEQVLGLEDADDGVVRVSLVHYNTEEEIQQFIAKLEEVLST